MVRHLNIAEVTIYRPDVHRDIPIIVKKMKHAHHSK